MSQRAGVSASQPRRRATTGVALRSTASSRQPRAQIPLATGAPPGAGALAGAALQAAGALIARLLRREDVQRALAAGAILGSLLVASAIVKKRVESWPRFALGPSLAATGLPPELGPRARTDLERLPVPRTTSTFDPRLAAWVHASLRDLPWVQSVERVRLAPPSGVEFALVPRLPRARLGDGADAPVVTTDGAVIPAAYAACPEALPRLLGVASPANPQARREALAAGLSVLEALRGLPLPLEAIELSNLQGQDPLASEVVLVTKDGLRIDWGRPPGERPHREPAQLREMLERVLKARATLPPLARVSLRWEQPTFELAVQAAAPTPAAPLRAGARR